MNDKPAIPIPRPAIRSLNRLIGTWELSGDSTGTVTYEWMEGGFFLLQHVDMHLFGSDVKALEVIGHLQPFGEPPSPEARSRAYDTRGNTLDYVYEIDGDTLLSGAASPDPRPTTRAPLSTRTRTSGSGPSPAAATPPRCTGSRAEHHHLAYRRSASPRLVDRRSRPVGPLHLLRRSSARPDGAPASTSPDASGSCSAVPREEPER